MYDQTFHTRVSFTPDFGVALPPPPAPLNARPLSALGTHSHSLSFRLSAMSGLLACLERFEAALLPAGLPAPNDAVARVETLEEV